MVDFAGWEMPVQYRSILEEHKAVRRNAGLFDVSHMGEVDIRGPDAGRFLNHLVTNDVSRLFPAGYFIADVLSDRRGGGRPPDLYARCGGLFPLHQRRKHRQGPRVDARAGGGFQRHHHGPLPRLRAAGGAGAEGRDNCAALTSVRLDLVKYYHFTEGTVAGLPCLISRTGYTGEDGFELYHAAEGAPRLAETLLAAGAPHGLELAGLGARDSLRLEAGYPLYGHEITAEVFSAGRRLNWTVKLDKGADFIGRAALAAEKSAGPAKKIVFFKTGDRRIVRGGSPVLGSAGEVASWYRAPYRRF